MSDAEIVKLAFTVFFFCITRKIDSTRANQRTYYVTKLGDVLHPSFQVTAYHDADPGHELWLVVIDADGVRCVINHTTNLPDTEEFHV